MPLRIQSWPGYNSGSSPISPLGLRPAWPRPCRSCGEMSDTEGSSGRAALVCEACRIRHRKCDWEDEACRQCKSIGLDCVRQPAFRFRYDALQKKLPRTFRSHSNDGSWQQPGLTFYDETPGLHDIYDGWDAVHAVLPSAAMQAQEEPNTAGATPVMETGLTPFHTVISSNTSPLTATTFSPGAQAAGQSGFTPSEARLIRNFADNMALWNDNADPHRHFELEVPRLALSEPLLRHAVCAFSARHFYRHTPDRDAGAESLRHQSKCLELLIPAISGERPINDITLTAVALLRQNEEMDGETHALLLGHGYPLMLCSRGRQPLSSRGYRTDTQQHSRLCRFRRPCRSSVLALASREHLHFLDYTIASHDCSRNLFALHLHQSRGRLLALSSNDPSSRFLTQSSL